MSTKKHIKHGERVPLKLTVAQRKLILDDLMCLDKDYEQAIRTTPSGKPVMMSLDALDDFGGYIAAEANHCEDGKRRNKLDAIFKKIEGLLDKYTDEEPPQTIKIEDVRKAKAISDQAVQIATWAAQAMIAAEQLGIKQEPFTHFQLAPAQREVLLLVPGVSKSAKNKLAKELAPTVAEVASITMALAEDLTEGDARKQLAVLLVAKHLMDQLQVRITGPVTRTAAKQRKAKPKTATLFQLKITLLDIKPPIWRRIQVQDCTLDKLHEHIQTAMGWTNSHLHQFEIDGERYGDLELLDDGFEDFECIDSTRTMISKIMPKTGKLAFKYEYDFGDGWEHEILFEGYPPLEKGKKYPLCLEGERACPPEDVGGIGGYEDFLESISDPKHEEHTSFLNWCGGSFSPDEFDPTHATRRMVKGLPDWRKEEYI